MIMQIIQRNQIILFLMVLCLGCIAYMGIFLRQPALNLIDDGHVILKVLQLKQELSFENWQAQLYEVEIGRFRPLYYLYFFFLLFFGTNPLIFWIGQLLTLMLLVGLVYGIFVRVTRLPAFSFMSTLPVFFLPAVAENFYRLGTAEVRQVVLLLLFIFYLTFLADSHRSLKFTLWGLMIGLFAFMAKETSLLLIPAYYIYILLRMLTGKLRVNELILGIGLTVVGFLFYSLIPESTGYAAGFQVSPNVILLNAHIIRASIPEMFWIWCAGLVFTSIRVSFQYTDLKSLLWRNFWLILILGIGIGATALQLPWLYQLERYFLFVYLCILMYVGLEIKEQLGWGKGLLQNAAPDRLSLLIRSITYSGVSLLFISLVTSLVFLPQSWRVYRLIDRTLASRDTWFTQYQYSYGLIRYLWYQVPAQSNVYMTHNDYEVIYEVGLFASDFFRRELNLYSENAATTADFGMIYQVTGDIYSAYSTDMTSNKILIVRGKPVASMSATLQSQLWPDASSVARDERLVWSIWQ